MKKIVTEKDSIIIKICYLEAETKRLTNRVNDKYWKKAQTFRILSELWIKTFSELTTTAEEVPDYQRLIQRMNKVRDMMADFAILGRVQNRRER